MIEPYMGPNNGRISTKVSWPNIRGMYMSHAISQRFLYNNNIIDGMRARYMKRNPAVYLGRVPAPGKKIVVIYCRVSNVFV